MFDDYKTRRFFENLLNSKFVFNEVLWPCRRPVEFTDRDGLTHIIYVDLYIDDYTREAIKELYRCIFDFGGPLHRDFFKLYEERKVTLPEGVDWLTVWSVLYMETCPYSSYNHANVVAISSFCCWLYTGKL